MEIETKGRNESTVAVVVAATATAAVEEEEEAIWLVVYCVVYTVQWM